MQITNTVDSDYINTRVDASALDSAELITIIDSDYINSRVDHPAIDSAATINLIDQAYVENLITQGFIDTFDTYDQWRIGQQILSTVDSDYVMERVDIEVLGIDSAEVEVMVDSDYVEARIDPELINNLNVISEVISPSTTAVVKAIDKTTYSAFEAFISARDSDGEVHITKVLAGHNSINSYITEYGVVYSSNELFVATANLDSSNIELSIENLTNYNLNITADITYI